MARTTSLTFLLSSLLGWAAAFNVYINSEVATEPISPQGVSFMLSRHLGLEAFEPDNDGAGYQQGDEDFVGKGWRHAALIIIDEKDAEAILPSSSRPFYASSAYGTYDEALSFVASIYKHRARYVYSSVWAEDMSPKVSALQPVINHFTLTDTPSFAAVELSYIANIRGTYGISSEEYAQVIQEAQSFIQQVYGDDSFHCAIMTYSPTRFQTQYRRDISRDQTTPSVSIAFSGTACFASVNACQNSTEACSGRGECRETKRAGKTCFTCACSSTKSGQGSKVKTEHWVGDSCERKDVSGPFVLLTGTAVVLILLAVGSVSLLSAVGSVELPSTLLATAVPAKRE